MSLLYTRLHSLAGELKPGETIGTYGHHQTATIRQTTLIFAFANLVFDLAAAIALRGLGG